MSLLLEQAPAVADPSRRRRSVLPAVAVLAVVAGLLGSLLLVAPRASSLAPLPVRASGAPFVTIPEYGLAGAHVLGYEHHAEVRLTVPLRNTGRLPMTVTAVRLDAGVAPLLVVQVASGLPLRLGPGEQGEVVLAGVLTNCRYFHEREMQTFTGLEVAYRTLGRSAVRVVPFDRPVLVKSPMLPGCPDRKLNRQADNRSDLL